MRLRRILHTRYKIARRDLWKMRRSSRKIGCIRKRRILLAKFSRV